MYNSQIVKPFLEPKTRNKVKFVYSDDLNTKKIMEDLFDMDQLESAFGGNNNTGFDINKYAERMKEDDKRIPAFWTRADPPSAAPQPVPNDTPSLDSIKLEGDSDPSNSEKKNSSPSHGIESDMASPDHNKLVATDGTNPTEVVQ